MTVKTINPPIYSGSTVLFDAYEDLALANKGIYDGITYGTDRLPTQRAFEDALNELEGGYITRAFQSGISAIITTLLAFTRAGDHILVCENVYGPTARFCHALLTRYNIEVTTVPSAVGVEIGEFIQPNTRLIFLESPGSNTFEIQDIEAVTAVAVKHKIVTVLDNTWATPLFLNPFQFGVDISIQSVTKYIAGHSDVLLGSVTVNRQYGDQFKKFYKGMENYASPQDCYLALRGLKTLSVRLRQHEQSALRIARWLEEQDLIERVIHPALASHPQHHLWQKYFSGSTGLFAFSLDRNFNEADIATFVNSLSLFGIGYSWGGYQSLVTAGKYRRPSDPVLADTFIIRLSIGLEETDDLLENLANGLQKIQR